MGTIRARDAIDDRVDSCESAIHRWLPRAIALLLLVALGWLYLSPPTLHLGATDGVIACRPLGVETPGDVWLTTGGEREETVQAYLESAGPWIDDVRDADDSATNASLLERAVADADRLCHDARENRQTTLLLGTAALLALLIWRTRRTPAPGAGSTPIGPSDENSK